jgi:CDP-4-dehydro-6-deoxyglucose reductase, E1
VIKLTKSTFYNEEDTKRKLANFIVASNILSMGEETKKFEKDFAKKQGRRFAVMTTSGSSANLLLLQALKNIGGIATGNRVGFSALTWSTNVMPILQLGMEPVAIDCEIKTLNVSSSILLGKLNSIDVLLLTNALGFADDIQNISKLCRNNNVLFIEDNCESLGSRADGKLLGNFGLASTFSFFVGHHLSTVEGGMIATDDEELYHALLTVRAHGWDRNLPKSKQYEVRTINKVNDFFAKYTFYDLAYNLRPTDIQGFLGSSQLCYWDELVSKREANYTVFNKAISNNKDLISIDTLHMDLVSNFAMPVIAKSNEAFNYYRDKFEHAEVEIRPIVAGNITRQPFYKKYCGDECELPNADFIHQNAFYFPNNAELSEEEVGFLTGLLIVAK